MAEFLFSRADGAPDASTSVDAIGPGVFWQLWAVKQDPFNVLEDGDTLWWADQRSREVRWELRVRNVRRAQYSSIAFALERLRRWFGLLPGDMDHYHENVRPEGWLLAWEAELVAPVGRRLPQRERLGRNGFRRLDHDQARSFGLPAPGRPAAIPIETVDDDPDILAPPRIRHIPLPVRFAVFERDGHRCRLCGTTDGEMHLDHIHPWSKGGANTVDNLQVLCAGCNLAKGAAAEQGRTVVPVIPSLASIAVKLNRDAPDSPADLQSVLERAVNAGLIESVKTVIWDLFHHSDFDGDIAEAIVEALDGVDDGDLALDAQAFAVHVVFSADASDAEAVEWLEELLDADDHDIAARAAADLAWADGIPKDRKLALAQRGLSSSDPRVCAVARLLIAAFAEDDVTWREGLLYAIDHGDAFIASRAALDLGAEVADDGLAYEFLERAMRSPSPDIAQAAAEGLADLFADKPRIANVYMRRAKELADMLSACEAG
jgi:hypothetical protein